MFLLIVVAETEYSSGITNNEVLEYKFDYSKFNRIYILIVFKNFLRIKLVNQSGNKINQIDLSRY